MARDPSFGYSATVRLTLLAGGLAFPLAKVGPERVVLQRGGVSLAPGVGEVIMLVDGREKRWSVVLSNGIVPFDRNVEIATPT